MSSPQTKPVTRGKRLAVAIGSTGLVQVLGLMESLLLVPLFLRAWGPSTYGNWLTLTAMISYLTLLELGGQSYLANLLTFAHARNDRAAFGRYLSEGVSLFLGLGAIVWLILTASLLLIVQNDAPFGDKHFWSVGARWI